MGKLSRFLGAQDMTVGKPSTCLIKFAAPLLVGNFAQQLYNTADAIVVGNFTEGDTGLAAIGATNPLINLILVLFMGISTGAGIMVSQYFGAKDRDKLSRTVGTAITLTFFMSLLIMVFGTLITRPVLRMTQTPPEVFPHAASYATIIFVGIIGCAYYNIISGILRGLGDSIMPLVYLLITCGLNIVLDIWFVAGFGWGVAGAAVATVTAQLVSGILCLVRLVRMKDVLDFDRSLLRPSKALSGQLFRLGLPAGLTQMIFSLAMMMVQSITNAMGEFVIAASTVVMRVDGFAMMPNFTFGIAMTTFTGQNIGAGMIERVDQGVKDGMKVGMLVSCVLTGCILLFGHHLMRMFTNTPAVIELGVLCLRILAVGYLAMGVTQILSGVMRGAGDTMMPMWISIFTTVIVRLPLVYALAHFTRSEQYPSGDPLVLYTTLLISWVLGAVLTVIFFRMGRWRTKGITQQGA